MKPKIIFTTPLIYYPTIGGPSLRIHTSILALSNVTQMHLFVRMSPEEIGGSNAVNFYSSVVEKFIFSPSSKLRSSMVYNMIRLGLKGFVKIFLNRVLKKLFNTEFQVTEQMHEMDVDFIIDYAKEHDINIIWCGYGNISYEFMRLLNDKAPWIKIVCDTDSVWSRFIFRELVYETDPQRRIEISKSGRIKEWEEREWVQFCDITTAVSEIDAQFYRQLLPEDEQHKINIFSNVIELDFYNQKKVKDDRVVNPCIHLAGTFGKNSAMDKATRWFIQEVFPLIRAAIPNIRLNIIGNNSDTVLSDIDDHQIHIFGRVENMMHYLPYADVAIVPLFFESGTRYKILEAAATKVPMVSTVLGAEGIPLINGEGIYITDDPGKFAEYTIRLIQDKDLAKAFTENAYTLIRDKYSVAALEIEAKRILYQLNGQDQS